MKFKKLKLLLAVVAFAPLCLLAACGGSEKEPSTTPSTPSSSSQSSSQENPDVNVLSFLDKGKARFELYDLDVNVSYGNQALTAGVNVVELSDSSKITFNKNTTENDVYCLIIVAEMVNSESLHTKAYKQIEGNSLLEFQDLIKNELVGYERAFVTITKGTTAKWTKGLSNKLDDKMTSLTK